MLNLSHGNDFLFSCKENHFHKKGCALGLILKMTVFGTRKWPIARYYIHLARSKSETPRLDVFVVLGVKLKFTAKEKLPLKLEATPNTEISGPRCTFLICVVTSRVNVFKYVLFFLLFVCLFCFSALLVSILYAPCINRTVSLVIFFL